MKLRHVASLVLIFLLQSLDARGQVAVLTYHNDNARSGQNTNETILTHASVNLNGFGLVSSRPVDDWVYAQPLVMTNVNIPGKGVHNIVIVATVNDSLYAFDADDPNVTTAYWQTNFLSPTAVAIKNTDMTGACGGNYQDFHGNMGIVGTPVIDPASGTLYVIVRTKENSTTFVQRLRALDVATGLERSYSPTLIGATYRGIMFDTQKQNQRPGLALANGIIYSTSASHCDWGPYHGWVIQYAATNFLQLSIYNTTPSGGLGGIWQGGCPPAFDSSGNLFFATGNGTFSTPSVNNNSNNFGDSILKLSTNSGLSVVDYFTPYDQASLEGRDADLGSGAVMILPDSVGSTAHPHLLVQAGKDGKIYLVDRDNMGHYNGVNDNQIVQFIPGAIGGSFDTPAYFNNTIYYGGSGDTIKAFRITNGLINPVTPLSQSPSGFGFPGSTTSVSANGTNNPIVWAIDNGAWGSGGPAILHAYNATNLALELYNSSQAGARDRAAGAVKFTVPTVANGKVYVGGQYALSVYGNATFINPPIISPNGGIFTNSVTVSMSDTTPGVAIFYSLDGSAPGSNSLTYAGPFVVTNTVAVKARAFKAGAVPSQITSATFVSNLEIGSGTGLTGNYYSNHTDFAGSPTLIRIDPTVNFDWGTGAPAPTIGADKFTVRWTGDVQPLFGETYTFYGRADDGIRVWVNGALLIDHWIDEGPTEWTGTIGLMARRRYAITMEYYENGGGAVAQLSWSSPSTAKTIIPTSQLYPVHNASPYVFINNPLNGQKFTGTASITLNATAGDPDGSVTRVDYYAGTNLLGSATTSPYYLTVPGLAPGTYSLTAVATDNGGSAFTSGAVNITVTAVTGAPYGLTSRAASAPFFNMPSSGAGVMPAKLSQTGAFGDVANLTPAGALVPYDVIVPFWSDSAIKKRWLMVPNDGAPYLPQEQIGFAPTGEWTFPAGTVFVKHFEIATNDTNPNLKRRLETRLLVRDTNNAVYGVTYRWKPDNSDADLLTSSLSENIVISTGSGTRTQVWYYPSPSDCLVCHTPVSGYVLGMKTRQLNANFTYPATAQTDNQIRTFNRLGMLMPAIDETNITAYAHLSALGNLSASLEERSRSYLDANCAQCHRPGNTIRANFDARYDTPLASQGIVNGSVINDLGLDNARVVAPKDIWRSLLHARTLSLDPTIKMPPLARNLYDTNGLQVLTDWINSLPGTPALAPPTIVPNGGSFVSSASVTLQHSDPSAALRYTLDNTLPTSSSPLFTGPFNLTASATVKVKAFEPGFTDSVATSAFFFIRPPVFFTGSGYFSNGQFQFGLSSLAGRTYVFEASSNLTSWQPISTNFSSSNLLNFLDPAASNFPSRFYRAIEQP